MQKYCPDLETLIIRGFIVICLFCYHILYPLWTVLMKLWTLNFEQHVHELNQFKWNCVLKWPTGIRQLLIAYM